MKKQSPSEIERAERQRAALRANLHRRKEQARAMAARADQDEAENHNKSGETSQKEA